MKFLDVQSLFGTLGHLLLICGITFCALQVKRRPPITRWTILILCVGVGFLPIHNLALVGYLRSLLGDLSLPTQILLGCTVIHHLLAWNLLCNQDRKFVLILIGVAGLVLYPTAGGYLNIDSYAMGFDSFSFALILIPLVLWAWYLRPRAALVLLISVVAFNSKILESTNMWDYLLDPAVTIYAWATILLGELRR